MLESLHAHSYPHSGVLRFDRRRTDGEILHPFAGRHEEGKWDVKLYLPFQEACEVTLEQDFIVLPKANAS